MKNAYNEYKTTYYKNAEKMERAKAMCKIAREQGNKELERKFRKEYLNLKSEIDATLYNII